MQENQRWQHGVLAGGLGGVPVVISQSQTYAGSQAVVTRQRDIAAAGFDIRLQEEEAIALRRRKAAQAAP